MGKPTCRYRWATALLIAGCMGCGSSEVAVTGNVTWNGQPVEQGTIMFRSADSKGPGLTGRIEQGAYTVTSDDEGAAGHKVVSILATRKTGRMVSAGPPEPPDKMVEEVRTLRYGRKGELTCELVAGKANQFDFEIPATKP